VKQVDIHELNQMKTGQIIKLSDGREIRKVIRVDELMCRKCALFGDCEDVICYGVFFEKEGVRP